MDDQMPGRTGELIRKVKDISLVPPYPWGNWLYSRVFKEQCARLEGDIIELGVGKGGMSIFLAYLAADNNKKVFSFDSFEGLPKNISTKNNLYFKAKDYAGSGKEKTDLYSRFLSSIEQHGFKDITIPVKGFFSDTLSTISPNQKFCFAHLDSDLYESVYQSLEAIFEKVVDGGIIVIDDFFHHAQGPLRACSEFFNSLSCFPVYHVVFPYSVFIIKGEDGRNLTHKRALDGNHYSFEWLKNDDHFRNTLMSYIDRVTAVSKQDEPSEQLLSSSIYNAELLLSILTKPHSQSSDIYFYWAALEDYWDSFADYYKKHEKRDTMKI